MAVDSAHENGLANHVCYCDDTHALDKDAVHGGVRIYNQTIVVLCGSVYIAYQSVVDDFKNRNRTALFIGNNYIRLSGGRIGIVDVLNAFRTQIAGVSGIAAGVLIVLENGG